MPFGKSGGVHGCLGAATHAHLGEQVRHVVLHRLFGEEHLVGDLTVGETLSEEFEDAALLVRPAATVPTVASSPSDQGATPRRPPA